MSKRSKTRFGTGLPLSRANIRVVYRRDDGKLYPRDTDGKVVDAMPADAGIEEAESWARWIVDSTAWATGGIAHVQEFCQGKKWVTVHTAEF